MVLLTIIYENGLDIAPNIQDVVEIFKNKDINLGICESQNNNTHFIKIMCDDKIYSESLAEKVNYYISDCIYDIIIRFICEEDIYNFILDNYFFLNEEEIKDIEKQIIDILKYSNSLKEEESIYYENRKNHILLKIKSCLEENRHQINIDGYIKFRVKELMVDIEDISNKVVENYMIEREYNEFIRLLKYFVDIQESKIDKINIIISKEGTYDVKDDKGNSILNTFVGDILENEFNDPSINTEDIIISGLITNVPNSIIIHGSSYCLNKEFIETINKVFTYRVEICDGCNECKGKPLIFST
ncbi:putative sporulation protein YtxC [Clostridium algidicarnis]|uniref:putative sporulation protein YtxC n=1 Tax=Clostridium algidicarnis TaxID=37659 RepID=UPI001C0C080E|nr:putative sporulation protein YtxC [Clostridium algidicarnis]MBU3195345.1 putative sporulation protein YtxC [Clostridium algidicarnis]MBU3208304.1 putative sporulation protein YtxC [Clostridium algidicarnis]MBU3227464.1 putative sporulation protein YtxC [Clostridium algidicarnis]MBU3251129.1 putative sporulation protein YtxC [Clostridium algidicarnis]